MLSLPSDVLTVLYNDWIKLGDVRKLDSAICNREHRKQFLSDLSAVALLQVNTTTKMRSVRFLKWCISRGLWTDSLALDRICLKNILILESRTFFSSLKILKISNMNTSR